MIMISILLKITTDHDHDKYITTQEFKFNIRKLYCKTKTTKSSSQKRY